MSHAVNDARHCAGFRSSLHRNYIGALERGEINPTFKTLRALARGLHVELSSLIHLYEERADGGDVLRSYMRRVGADVTANQPAA